MSEVIQETITFQAFPKLSRLRRECIVTEKIDGTNAQIIITDDGQIGAASRSRLLTPESDNFGFAAWVRDNREDLMSLGPGRHFGEWWGRGIQRGYGQKERIFSLFNTERWSINPSRPKCCSVVPTLYQGPFDTHQINQSMVMLKGHSLAAPGYDKPEGIVVFHTAARVGFKWTFEKDDGKGTEGHTGDYEIQ